MGLLFFRESAGVCVNDFDDSAPPWRREALWRAAVTTVTYLIRQHDRQLAPVKDIAGRIIHQVDAMDALLDRLCKMTCTRCPSPCCRVADVSYDFRDLLLMLLTGQQVPKGQPRHAKGEVCRYLGKTGCRLQRQARPWICTWYICAAQKPFISGSSDTSFALLTDLIASTGTLRKEMENRFIDMVAGR